MGRVMVLGSLMTDFVARAPRLPLPGESLLGDEFGIFVGGKGCNQAVAAARMGARVSLIGRVGADDFGESIARVLAAERIEHAHVSRDPRACTGASVIMLGANGQNAIVALPRANDALTSADVDAALRALLAESGPPPTFLAQCETPLETVACGLRLARAASCRTLLNAAPVPRRPLEDALLGLVEILIVNETEAAALSGQPVDDRERAHRAATRLLARGPRAVVVTLGAQGFVCHTREFGGDPAQEIDGVAITVRAVDATAAGDAFCGTLAASLAEGRTLAEGLRWANAAGALAVTRLGALPSLPWREDIAALLADQTPA